MQLGEMDNIAEHISPKQDAPFLVPPSVSSLRIQDGGPMERSLSEDIREEREDLREAAEQTLNVIMDLSLDGHIRWVSPSWTDVIGTTPEDVQGKPISELILDENKNAFAEVVESMQKDDSRSRVIRFRVLLGPASRLAPLPGVAPEEEHLESVNQDSQDSQATIDLEAQGIMVYDRTSGGESHVSLIQPLLKQQLTIFKTMWMIRPWIPPREIKIDLPQIIVEGLGSGAEVLASYLTTVAEAGLEDPAHHPPPLPVLCRICERQIPPWWFEKHTELCLLEHKAELEVQLSQENLTEHRHAIVKVLDALEARKSRPLGVDQLASATPPVEYKGMAIGPATTSPSSSSGSGSPAPLSRSRESSATGAAGFGHSRARSFAIRRPQARVVELLLDLCDTALEINTPAIKELPSQALGEFRTQSPQSENRIAQVVGWQSPSTNTLEQELGLAALCADTEKAAKAKVEAIFRHRRILEYSERIRTEFSLIVQDIIDKALRKAAQIAAGHLTDSSESDVAVDEEDITPATEQPFFTGSFDGPSSLAQALREAEKQQTDGRRASSTAVSTGSSSPKECPTPRSHGGNISLLSQSRDSRRGSLYVESDNNDSDGGSVSGSLRSSSLLYRGLPRTESPVNEFGGDLRRAASERQRHRRSLILPGANSPQRQESPSRLGTQPSSPLRISKPRALATTHEGVRSPLTSPLLTHSDFTSPSIFSNHHHRRQSSAAASDMMRPPGSPRLNAVSAPQARAVPPSIKDFEIIKPISKGAFGSVYLSKKKSTGDYFAIKVLKKADMVAKNQVTNVKAERAIMMWQGESDFVAKLYWTFSSKDYLYLVMEYLNGGDCASLIKVLGGLPEDWAKKYLGEVILGVEHLHSRGITHRDLKPDNLLIDQKGHLKLTDFGLSRMGLIGRQKRVLDSGNHDTAPDLLKQGPFVDKRSTSISSSRSTSFDFHGHNSPGSTPQMTPDLAGSLGQPSYFNLNRENSLNRESRRSTGHRSDSGGSESLNAMFSSFSLNDTSSQAQQIFNQRKAPIDEMSETDQNASPDILTLSQVPSQAVSEQKSTPPQTSMMPPPMALFDPDDANRRFVGTPDYLAPETVNGVGQDERSDWWSVGCILFEFLYGYPPFHADTPDQVFENILARRITWPEDDEIPVSSEAKDLINKLLCMDPKERLGSNKDDKFASGGEEIRKHSWFADINWETLLQDEAQFVPAPENPEDTEYFDSRGATLKSFAEEMEDQTSPQTSTPGGDYAERPHDALSKVRSQVNSIKRGLMPLHIPPHVRDMKTRRLSEPVAADDFGNFAFKNLPVLEKANKDIVQKLRAEAMASSKPAVVSPITGPGSGTGPSLEGSPVISMPISRSLSNAKSSIRPSSPSGISQTNSSPSRASQPSSPLLLSFVAGQNGETRRKTSSNSSYSTTASLQPGNFFEVPRIPPSLQKASTTIAISSPIKARGGAPPPAPLALSPQKMAPQAKGSTPVRARSQTVGSQEGSPIPADMFSAHRKRRSQVFDMSPSSSDNEGDKVNALLRVQRRRQSSRRLSAINLADGPVFRPLDVLICEDHPVSKMVMEKLLERLRCRTIVCSNGADACRIATSEIKFDIIMMEFKLPQINGADVARIIRETKNANTHTPIVAITGYLKEFPGPLHFDALIEKPPTNSKLVDVLCRLCQWKAPSPGQLAVNPLNYPSMPMPMPMPMPMTMSMPSGLRQESLRQDDSPTTSVSAASSGYARMPGSSFRGSSREDSISSSLFGDTESVSMDDHVPIIVSRKATGDWGDDSTTNALGITSQDTELDLMKAAMPHLTHQVSAPPDLNVMSMKIPIRQRSSDKLRAKRKSLERQRHESAESGDDEDEELGDAAVRERERATSPKSIAAKNPHRSSKLSTEMMRTNSRGSVVSSSEYSTAPESSPLEMHAHAHAAPKFDMPIFNPPRSTSNFASEKVTVTPPNLATDVPPDVARYTTPPGSASLTDEFVFNDDTETPKPRSTASDENMDEEPTPRASAAPVVKEGAAGLVDYLTAKGRASSNGGSPSRPPVV
jgi:serine/threonine-protein kinase RIM15